MQSKKNLLVVSCVLIAACSTHGQVDPDVMQVATAPLTCTAKTDCDTWWQRARTWVTTHSRYDVTVATDSLIQTAGPDGGKRALAYEITMAPNNDGTATIGFSAHCDSSLGCRPNPWEAAADFKEFVRTGSANPASAVPSATAPAQSMRSPASSAASP